MKLNKTAIFFVVLIFVVLATTMFLSMFIGPILLGFLIAYLINPLLIYLESRGISRNTSAIISIILIILLAATVVWIILPILITQIETIVSSLPEFKLYLQQKFYPQIQKFLTEWGLAKGRNFDLKFLNLEEISKVLLTGIGQSTKFLVATIFFIVATPIFMFVFMKHLPKFYNLVYRYVPEKTKPVFLDYFKEINAKLKAVIRGQLLVVLIMTILYPIAFLIAGLPTAIGLGVLVGLGRIIAGLDTIIAIVLGTIIVIVNGSSLLVILFSIIGYLCVQGIDNFIVTPKIMGKTANLHPLIVLLSIFVFGYWFGIYGAVFAIPIVTILKVSIQRILNAYIKSPFFQT